MIYFLHGPDSYRSKKKLEDIVNSYKKVHKSGLNLVYLDAVNNDFRDFISGLNTVSMFAEKKLVVLKNVFSATKFQEDFLKNIKKIEDLKDIIIIYEDEAADKRTKLFKELEKSVKCQEFDLLSPIAVKKWILQEFELKKKNIEPTALDLLVLRAGNDSWRVANEISKLCNYKDEIKKQDVELLVKNNTESDIFKTIDALVEKDKRRALALIHKHLDDGEAPLYLLSMIAYQFRNLLIVKDMQLCNVSYGAMAKKSGLHPFVLQKTSYMCQRFTLEKLKKIYHDIFVADLDIKTGKIEAETALDLLLSRI